MSGAIADNGEGHVPVKDLILVIGSVAAITASYGIAYPLLSALIELEGLPGSFNGFTGAMMALGTLCAGPIAARLLRRYPAKYLVMTGLFCGSFMFLLFPAVDMIIGWTILRFMLGFMDGIAFVASETWISTLANDKNRGRIMGFYGTALAAGFASGPFLLQVTGIHGVTPFVVSFCLVAATVIPLRFAQRRDPDPEEQSHGSFREVLRIAPLGMVAAGFFALVETSTSALLAPYSLRLGLAEGAATLVVGWAVIGAILTQIPAGYAADKYDKRLMLAFGAISSAAVLPFMPWAITAGWIGIPVLMIWVALFSSSYPAGLALIGQHFKGAQLATAMAAFAMCYSMGSMMGPIGGGVLMDFWDPHGFLLWLGFFGLAFGSFALWRFFRSKPGLRPLMDAES